MIQKILNLFAISPVLHEWELVAKTYAAPIKGSDLNGLDEFIAPKALFGVTTYVWQCKKTGDMRKEEVLGTDENQLYDILEKVDKFGMQYVKENGNVYGIAQWVPPEIGKK